MSRCHLMSPLSPAAVGVGVGGCCIKGQGCWSEILKRIPMELVPGSCFVGDFVA